MKEAKISDDTRRKIKAFVRDEPAYSLDKEAVLDELARNAISGDEAAFELLTACADAWSLCDAARASCATMLKIAAKKLNRPTMPRPSPAEQLNRRGFAAVGRSDFSIARKCFVESSAADSADAINNLAFLFQRGLGAPQDTQEAQRLYRKASDRGSVSGGFNLAMLLLYGIGCSPKFDEAAFLLRQLSERDDTHAKQSLAYLTLTEKFTGMDMHLIEKWSESKLTQQERPPFRFALRNQPPWTLFSGQQWTRLLALGPVSVDIWQGPLVDSTLLTGEKKLRRAKCLRCGFQGALVRRDKRPSEPRCLGCFYRDEPLTGDFRVGDEWLIQPEAYPFPTSTIERQLPSILSHNFDGWAMHCDVPAIYLGIFGQEDFYLHAGKQTAREVCSQAFEWDGGTSLTFEDLSLFRQEADTMVHAFRCKACAKMLAVIDMS